MEFEEFEEFAEFVEFAEFSRSWSKAAIWVRCSLDPHPWMVGHSDGSE